MPRNQELLNRLSGRLQRDARVAAIWVDGSLARGTGDEYSDLDIGIAAEDENLDGLLKSLPDLIRDACDTVLIQARARLLNLVTSNWERADVFVRTRSEAAAGVPGPIRVVHDPSNCVRVAEPSAPAPVGDRLVSLVEEFIRFLGLLPVVAHRGEWIGAYTATATMAAMVTELMQLENGTLRVGGALQLSHRLSEQQRQELHELPPLTPDRESVVAVQAALARLFLPRARQVARSHDIAYPEALEAAALLHLRRCGIDVPL